MCGNVRYQKSSVQTYNNSAQTVAANSSVNLGNTSVDTGCSICHTSGSTSLSIKNPGLYLIMFDAVGANSTLVSGDVTVQLYKNGIVVPDAFSSSTSASSTDNVSLSFAKLVQISPSCCAVDNSAQFTFVNTGVSTTFSHVNVVAYKLA